jgi:nickel superoxide dismutase
MEPTRLYKEQQIMKKNGLKMFRWMFLLSAGLFLSVQSAYAHCQLPCGIYDDHARILSMLEDVRTIEKSVRLITELSGENDPLSQNQQIRWVMNKEEHAGNIISTMCDYFLTQRVKPDMEDYLPRLKKHHTVIIGAMKVKQTVDMEMVKQLKKDVEALLTYYPAHDH